MLNQAIVDEWLEMYRDRLLEAFGERLVFAGCLGSWGRGEGRPDSDIDAVAILDCIRDEDLATYRNLIGKDEDDVRSSARLSGENRKPAQSQSGSDCACTFEKLASGLHPLLPFYLCAFPAVLKHLRKL